MTHTEEQTTEEKWLLLEKQISDYQKNLSLNIHKNNAIEEILNLTTEQLKQLNAEECGINSFLLMQYSTFLQKEINRHAAKQRWANSSIDILLGKYGQQYGDKWTKVDERKILLIADNSYAKALNEMIRFSSVVMEDLSYLAKKIETMAIHLSELQKTKRGNSYEKSRSS
jgi:hypothetical protein